MSNIPIFRFEEVEIDIIDGDRGNHYPKKTELLKNGGYCIFLNTGNITKTGFNFDNVEFISKKKNQKLRKGLASRGDIILTTRGTVGNVAYFNDSVPYRNIRINSGMVLLRVNINELNAYYLYCFLRSDPFKKQVILNGSGSAQPQLPIAALHNISLPIPSLIEQKKIVSVISPLDKKIELLRP